MQSTVTANLRSLDRLDLVPQVRLAAEHFAVDQEAAPGSIAKTRQALVHIR